MPYTPTRLPEGQVVAADTAEAAALGSLPAWDLSDLFPAPGSPELAAALDRADAAATAFEAAYKGKLAGLSGAALAAAIVEFEHIEEELGRAMSYAQLLFAEDSTNADTGRFYQSIQERVTAISAHTLFFGLEINRHRGCDARSPARGPGARALGTMAA